MRFLSRVVRSLILFLLPCLTLIVVPLARAQEISAPVKITFTTIDVPGAVYTGVWGVNKAGVMVGNYGQNINADSSGFTYVNGVFTYFSYPGQAVTVPTGINDSGLIVGSFGQDPVIGFLYDGTSFTPLQEGNDNATYTDGLNNDGEIVGGSGDIYTTKGFEMRNGHYRALNVPGQYVYVYGTGVNDSDTIVGWTDYNGFTCRSNTCQLFGFPGAIKTEAWGINDKGVVVGWYEKGPPYAIHGFALLKGKYLSVNYPGATLTSAQGINASGQVVGEYQFSDGIDHGFVTSPITAADFEDAVQ